MKKVLLLSTLLCTAMAMSAQELVKADLGELVRVKATQKAAAPVFNKAMRYSNSIERVNADDKPAWQVYTTASGVYSQIPVWSEENGYIAGYSIDFLMGPVLVGWEWAAVRPLDAIVGEPTYTYVQRDLASGESVDLPVVDSRGITTTFGSSESVVRITGVNGDGATASWDRMDLIDPADPTYTKTSLMYTPVMSERVNFSQAYWGNNYTFYNGYSSGEEYSENFTGASGFVSIFSAPITPLYIYGGNAIVVGVDNATSYDSSNITFEIWSVDEEGQLGEVLAQATDGHMYGNPLSEKEVGSLEFSFTETDPITMLPTAKPVSLPAGKKFAVVLNNITGSNLRVLMAMDPCGGVGIGGAYYIVNDKLDSFWGGGYSANDLAIGLNGYIPGGAFIGLNNNQGFLEIPSNGGVASTYDFNYDLQVENGALFGCSHNFYVEDGVEGETHVKMTYPDWITEAAVDTTGYSTTGRFALSFAADALPSGVDGRDGYVELDVYGFKARLQIGQGNFNVGVKDAEVAEVSASVVGDDFVLAYGEGVNRVDVVNVAGARVASYNLPAGGHFTVPASDFAKGLYILNFAGEKKATVKVVK